MGGSARFVVLFAPAGQDAWQGTLRIVALVKAAARYRVSTLRVVEPDLEERFFAIYRGEESSDAA